MRLHSFLVGASVLGYAAAFMPAAPKVASRSAGTCSVWGCRWSGFGRGKAGTGSALLNARRPSVGSGVVSRMWTKLIDSPPPPHPNPGSIHPPTVVVQAAANVKGSMAAGNGRKVLGHYIKKLKEGGFPEKAADKQFADYTDRELDALFDLSVDEYDKMVEDAYNEVGQFSMSAEEIKGVIGEALVASEGGEKAAPLGIEADYGGAQDVLLMTGLAFERVAAKLNQGGATGADGTKYLFMTDSQLKQFDTVRAT